MVKRNRKAASVIQKKRRKNLIYFSDIKEKFYRLKDIKNGKTNIVLNFSFFRYFYISQVSQKYVMIHVEVDDYIDGLMIIPEKTLIRKMLKGERGIDYLQKYEPIIEIKCDYEKRGTANFFHNLQIKEVNQDEFNETN